MRCEKPIRLTKGLDVAKYPDGLEVPCGKCLQCRIKKRSEWSMRMMLELGYWERSSFITLTYDDEHLPKNASLEKEELQKFFKRLRKRLSEYDRKIKYFACGEYGEQNLRPHYHAIVYGLGLQKEDKEIAMQSWRHCDWSVPRIRKKAFGLVEKDSIRYVAQYIDKKLSGPEEEEEFKKTGRQNVFRLLSSGIGRQYCDDYQEDLSERLCLTVNGVEYSLPRYFIKRLDIPEDRIHRHAIEKNCNDVERFTGLCMESDCLYKASSTEYMKYHEGITSVRRQRTKTLEGKARVKARKL